MLNKTLLDPRRYTAGNIEALTRGAAGDFYALSISEPWAAAYDPTRVSVIAERRNLLLSYMQSSQREQRRLPLTVGRTRQRIQILPTAETTPDCKICLPELMLLLI